MSSVLGVRRVRVGDFFVRTCRFVHKGEKSFYFRSCFSPYLYYYLWVGPSTIRGELVVVRIDKFRLVVAFYEYPYRPIYRTLVRLSKDFSRVNDEEWVVVNHYYR